MVSSHAAAATWDYHKIRTCGFRAHVRSHRKHLEFFFGSFVFENFLTHSANNNNLIPIICQDNQGKIYVRS